MKSAYSIRIYISTHTLTWSVTIVHKLKITVENNFNSHAHVERDRDVDMFQKCICYFNSHAHVERDFVKQNMELCKKEFQLTRSRGA